MRHLLKFVGIAWFVFMIVTGCTTSNTEQLPVPTSIDLETWPTAVFLTENAPPAGFGVVHFQPIDRHLADRKGWVYVVTGHFEGTFDDTGAAATGQFETLVQVNELGQTRRVVLEAEGNALLPDAALLRLEGVRWSNDYYIVDVNGRCSKNEPGSLSIADLSAGNLIGGVAQAMPTGHRQEIEGVPAWQYTFSPADIHLPTIHQTANSTLSLEADLWIAPDYNAVLRFETTITVEHVHIFWAAQETASTVSGTLYLRYDLSLPDFDVQPNISIPHGC